MGREKILIICGPTATGKTWLGVSLAKKFNGEIVSADSRQVYRYMDIGTGKDIPVNSKFHILKEFPKGSIPSSKQFQISNFKFQIGYHEIEKIPLWLLDIIEPDYRFNVADYKKCADVVLDNIWGRGKLPVLAGGTGFYIKAITDGIETIGIEPDWELRRKLQSCTVSELQRILEDLDPELRMNESDRKNPRRLIRAIEIARNSKFHILKEFPKGSIPNSKSISNFDAMFIGLMAPNDILYQRIDRRVDERVKAGVEKEIHGLLAKGYTWANSALGITLAYREWENYFDGKSTKEEVIRRWKFDEHNYARRQTTWFKRDSRIKWFDITVSNWQTEVEKLVGSWYS